MEMMASRCQGRKVNKAAGKPKGMSLRPRRRLSRRSAAAPREETHDCRFLVVVLDSPQHRDIKSYTNLNQPPPCTTELD